MAQRRLKYRRRKRELSVEMRCCSSRKGPGRSDSDPSALNRWRLERSKFGTTCPWNPESNRFRGLKTQHKSESKYTFYYLSFNTIYKYFQRNTNITVTAKIPKFIEICPSAVPLALDCWPVVLVDVIEEAGVNHRVPLAVMFRPVGPGDPRLLPIQLTVRIGGHTWKWTKPRALTDSNNRYYQGCDVCAHFPPHAAPR